MIDYYITPKEISVLLRVDIETVRRWARKGKYGARKLGRQWYFPRGEFYDKP